jgi:hypothetical protein
VREKEGRRQINPDACLKAIAAKFGHIDGGGVAEERRDWRALNSLL